MRLPAPLATLFLALAFFPSLLAPPLGAAPWRSTLYPESGYDPSTANLDTDKVLQDFSYAGYRRGEVPIPDVAGPVFDVTAAPFSADPTGATDSTSAIQSAINAAGAAGGGVVYLPAGAYRLSVSGSQALLIDKSGVVLRGAGRDQTFLVNTTTSMRGKVVIRVRGPVSESAFWPAGTTSNSRALSADLLHSTRVIPVTGTTPFSVGDTVVIRNDLTPAWLAEHQVPTDWGWSALKGLVYRRTVTAVNAAAGTITVDAPTRYALKTRDNARVVRLAAADRPLTEIGLEDFAFGNLQHPGSGWDENDYDVSGTLGHAVHGSFFIRMEGVSDSWVRRLATFQPPNNTSTAHLLSGALAVRQSTHVTIEDCVFQRPQYGGGGGNGYMFLLHNTGESLVQRCEARFSRHGFQISEIGSSGNVIHDCLDAETGHATGQVGAAGYRTNGRSSDHHAHFSHANLVDTCTAENSWFEARFRGASGSIPHGLSAAHSVYWNTRGTTTPGVPYSVAGWAGALVTTVVATEQARYGYVIGTRGTRTGVQTPTAFTIATNPPDHVEGVGLGDDLVPQSLFLDQRARRIGPAATLPPDPHLAFPANTVDIVPLGFTLGGAPVSASAVSPQWSAPAGVLLTPLSGGGVRAQVPGPGTWELTLTLEALGIVRTQSIVIVAELAAPPLVVELPAVADTYIEGGTPADTNYGTVNTIRLKRASGPSTTRHGLLRFNLSALGDDIPLGARLVLHAQRELATYAGWQISVRTVASSPAWTETGVNWNNAPAFGTVLATFSPSPSGVDVIDLTTPFLQAWGAGRTTVDIALVVEAQPDTNIHYYHSREQADASLRPRLEIDAAPAAASFSHWIANWPQLPLASRGPFDDPDGDGLPNILEMTFGRDPSRAEAGGPLAFIGGMLRFILADPAPADSSVSLEQSTDLVRWDTLPITSDQIAFAAPGLRLVDVPVSPPAPRAFWRLRLDWSP